MSDFNRTRNQREFVQEYAYIEDYSLFYKPQQRIKESDEHHSCIIEIDLDNGKEIEVI